MACTPLPLQFPYTLGRSLSKPSASTHFKPSKTTNISSFSSSIGSVRFGIDENPQAIISGEWPDNFSFLSFDDLRYYLEAQENDGINSKSSGLSVWDYNRSTWDYNRSTWDYFEQIGPSMLLGEVMSTSIMSANPDQTLEEIDDKFEVVSGLPVVDGELRCVGVISKSDKAKASNGMNSKVGEVMSSPAITLPPNKTVQDAAALMLKMKIHRIPILDQNSRVIGMVTRTDIFQALESLVVV